MTDVPTLSEVEQALRGLPSTELVRLRDIYLAEVSDQARRCRVDPYNDALASAIIRRCARALAMASVPLGVQFSEVGSVSIGSTDPEVRRLEAPYRKVFVG